MKPSLPMWESLTLLFSATLLQGCLSSSINQSKYTKNLNPETDNSTLPVAEIAKQVTVRIFTEPGSGSGVIVARQNQTYTVLTCQHVITHTQNHRYSILSVDGKIHQARLKPMHKLLGLDLALVEFDSKNNYQVVKLGDSKSLTVNTPIFAAGFPNYHLINQNKIEDTRHWGTKAFRLTTGKVMMLLTDKSLPEGYRLGYTNEVEVGMSGGPVLNKTGELVGINGRLKYPLQGINIFTFTDGSKPSQKIFEQMEALSWAIPIAIFQQSAADFSQAEKEEL